MFTQHTPDEIKELLAQRYHYILFESATPSMLASTHLDFYEVTGATPKERREAEISYKNHIIREMLLWVAVPQNYRRILMEEDSTRTVEQVIYRLKKEYDLKNWQFVKAQMCNKIEGITAETSVRIAIPLLEKNREIICDILTQEGYYLAQEMPFNIPDKGTVDWALLCFAPIKSKNISSEIREMKYVFHTTSEKNIRSILRGGLIPTSSSGRFKYPPRIYLWGENDITSARRYAVTLNSYSSETNEKYFLLRVKTEKIPLINEFYYDPLLNDAFFTTGEIPRDAFEIFEMISSEGVPLDVISLDYKNSIEWLEDIASQNESFYNRETYVMVTKSKEKADELIEILNKEGYDVSSKVYSEDDRFYFIVYPK